MAALTLSEKLDQLDARYQEMTQELSTPEVVTDSARFQKLAKQHSDLETIVNKHREFKQIEKDLAATHQMVVESETPKCATWPRKKKSSSLSARNKRNAS